VIFEEILREHGVAAKCFKTNFSPSYFPFFFSVSLGVAGQPKQNSHHFAATLLLDINHTSAGLRFAFLAKNASSSSTLKTHITNTITPQQMTSMLPASSAIARLVEKDSAFGAFTKKRKREEIKEDNRADGGALQEIHARHTFWNTNLFNSRLVLLCRVWPRLPSLNPANWPRHGTLQHTGRQGRSN